MAKAKKEKPKRHPKGIFAPILAIAVSAAGWIYGIANGFIDQLRSVYNGAFGASSQLASNSDFAIGNAGLSLRDDKATVLLIACIVLLVTIIGVMGIITLIKRLFNRIVYRDE